MVSRCIKGHYQPLLLLYADPRGTPVSSQDVPSAQLDLHHCSKAGYDSEDSGMRKWGEEVGKQREGERSSGRLGRREGREIMVLSGIVSVIAEAILLCYS